jgi:class 3 adenylate cyclase
VDPSNVVRRLTCILAADAVGYSKQVGEDEEGTIRVLSAHRAVIDGIITFHQGRIVSTAGDSVLAEFSSVVEAVRCAVEIQEALKTRNDSLPEARQMHFRIGVNLGDVVVKNEDLLGDGVNVASRLETMAEPGGICISSSVYDQITGKLDLGFLDIGEQTLKNISRPIRVYRVSGASAPLGRAPSAVPPTPPSTSAPRVRNPLPWAISAVVAILVGVAVAWQGGWLRLGRDDVTRRTTTATSAVPSSPQPAAPRAPLAPVIDVDAIRAQATSDARRMAEEITRQVEAELASVRSEAEAAKADRTRAQAEAAAARARAQADKEWSAARTKSEARTVARAGEVEATKSAAAVGEGDAKTRDSTSGQIAGVSDREPPVSGGVGRFDGTWNVTVSCPKSDDGALGYRYEFVAQVKDGILRGDQGVEGTAGWLRLQGSITPDGKAVFDANGLTGDSKYNVKGLQKGVPYNFQVAAHFEGSRGTGRRLQLRPCLLTFVKS